ncbi:DNA-3-methyladenine glycosylase [Candidatus Peregrinibacteria bacterium]|nr:DNA-3-methyladenine glycosylase [Candidatus Peregrinibacteria bacterium]
MILMIILKQDFFEQECSTVAKKLLGKRLHCRGKSGIITETEAYIGQDDPACHAAKGLTPRTKVMFGPAGHIYVYLIYGMYYCLNFVTEKVDFPAAVLIRGVYVDKEEKHYDGPGKLCKFFEIDKSYNGLKLGIENNLYLEDENLNVDYETTPRIGIKVGKDKYWRYIAKF